MQACAMLCEAACARAPRCSCGCLIWVHAREDVWLQGDADDVAADLAVATGWIDDLAAFEDALPEASRATLDRVR